MDGKAYEIAYKTLTTDAARAERSRAFGDEDIGQHSWTTPDELTSMISMCGLTARSGVLDIGCGAGGPAMFVASRCGCHVTGIDIDAAGIRAATTLATSRGLSGQCHFLQHNATTPMRETDSSFDAVYAIDSFFHIPHRQNLLIDIKRMLCKKGRLFFTDAGIIRGQISASEFQLRSYNGAAFYAPSGYNESLLQQAGLRFVSSIDLTENNARVAQNRFDARAELESELIAVEGETAYHGRQAYLNMVALLCRDRRLCRYGYVAERV